MLFKQSLWLHSKKCTGCIPVLDIQPYNPRNLRRAESLLY